MSKKSTNTETKKSEPVVETVNTTSQDPRVEVSASSEEDVRDTKIDYSHRYGDTPPEGCVFITDVKCSKLDHLWYGLKRKFSKKKEEKPVEVPPSV